MKKVFTLALALAAAAGMTASAQNIKLMAHGEEVQNGARVNIVDYWDEAMTQYNPHLTVMPGVSDEMEVTVNFVSDATTPAFDEDEWLTGAKTSIMYCWPSSCMTFGPGKELTRTGDVEEGKEVDLQIELSLQIGDEQNFEDVYVKSEFTVTVALDGEEMTATFYVDKPDANGVDGIEVDGVSAPVYYDLQGRKIAEPAKGLYIVKRGNKVSKEFVK